MKFLKYLIFYSLLLSSIVSAIVHADSRNINWLKNHKTGFAGLGKFFQNNSSNITLRDIGPVPFILTTALVYHFLSKTDGYQEELYTLKDSQKNPHPKVKKISELRFAEIKKLDIIFRLSRHWQEVYTENKKNQINNKITNYLDNNIKKRIGKIEKNYDTLSEKIHEKANEQIQPIQTKQLRQLYTKSILKATLISISLTYTAIWSCNLLLNKTLPLQK